MSEEKYHVEYLKPCPFCGRKDKLYIGKYKQPIGFGLYKENWNVGCEYCNVKMTLSADALMGDKSYDEGEAILAWNRRNGDGVVEQPKSDIPMEQIGVTALVDDVLDNDTVLLYGGWKIKGNGLGHAVNRYIEEEAKGKE